MKNRECPASCYVGNAKQELVYRAITDFAEGAYYDIHRDEVRNKTKIHIVELRTKKCPKEHLCLSVSFFLK